MKFKIACAICTMVCTVLSSSAQVHASEMSVPSNNAFKTYMGYTSITNKASLQYKMQQSATTDENGLRMFNGRYCIAVGTYYANSVGVEIDVTLDTGRVIHCITGDVKSDAHTDPTHRQIPINGNVVEFIVDTSKLPDIARRSGDISSISGFDGSITSIVVHGQVPPELYTTLEEIVPESIFVDNTTEVPDSNETYVVNKFTLNAGDKTLYFVDTNILETYSVSKETYDAAILEKSKLRLNTETNEYEVL